MPDKSHVCGRSDCKVVTANPKYCSLRCARQQYLSDNPSSPKSISRFCVRPGCKQEFYVSKNSSKKKYCSRSCAAAINNSLFPKKPAPATRECPNCGNSFTISTSTYKSFCSQGCKKAYRISQWLSGEIDVTTCTGTPGYIRVYLLEEADYRCQSPTCCVEGGWGEVNPVTGKAPLEVDHIDGDAYNNVRENLIVLCPNCHALTSTHRALNAGNGKRAYRKRYDYSKS